MNKRREDTASLPEKGACVSSFFCKIRKINQSAGEGIRVPRHFFDPENIGNE